MPRVLITGFNGFVGKHACAEFKSRGYEVYGISNSSPDLSSQKLVDSYFECDLTSYLEVNKIVLKGVGIVLNLAGYATNTGGDPELIKRTNTLVHTNLLDKLMKDEVSPRVIAVSSGAVYDPNQAMPETEYSKLKDPEYARPYESSKILMEGELSKYKKMGLDIVTVRPFNHIGPGQGPGFILPDLANKLLDAKLNNREIMTGNLETRRDYTDVRDVVKAYADLAEANILSHDIYNVCSGQSRLGSEILRLLKSAMRLEDVVIAGTDQTLLRKEEASDVYGSHDRITNEIGWKPTIKIEDTIRDFAEWRLA